jgi:molecular chaperone DnaJ
MAEKRDYYEVLGITKESDEKEIKKAYRKLAMKYHPDKAEESEKEEFTEKFKEISEAYAVLSDGEKKQKYDQFGHAGMDGYSTEDIFRNANFGGFEDIFNNASFEGSFDGFDLGDILGGIFGGGSRRRGGSKRGSDLLVRTYISLEEASTGVKKNISIKHDVICSVCNGSGAEPGSDVETCQTCGGTGQVKQVVNTIFGQQMSVSECRVCYGTGKIIKEPCHKCHGKGTVNESKKITIDIPAGVEDGNRLVVNNGGNSAGPNSMAGELYVEINIKHHKDFERHGADLYVEKEISFVKLSLGDKIDVKTIYGVVELNIPPGTESGKKFRLRGQGMPVYNSQRKGNLYVIVKVVVPKKLSDEQKTLLKKFASVSGEEINSTEKGLFDKVKDAIHH